MTATAQRVAEGDLDAAAPVTTDDEVGTLARTFNDMTARLRVVYDDLRHEIAQRQRIQEEREAFVAELEAKNAELERFTYTVSHDLKSPLFTIRGFLGLAEPSAASSSASATTWRRSAAHSTPCSACSPTCSSSRTSGAELAGKAVSAVAGAIAKCGVEVEIADDMPVVVGDRLRLAEVFQNLVENAIKFMGDQPAPRIEIGGGMDGGDTVCFVRDNGRGIEPQYREKIFELFERLDALRVAEAVEADAAGAEGAHHRPLRVASGVTATSWPEAPWPKTPISRGRAPARSKIRTVSLGPPSTTARVRVTATASSTPSTGPVTFRRGVEGSTRAPSSSRKKWMPPLPSARTTAQRPSGVTATSC